MLEEKVSEKYYLSDEQVYKFLKSPFHAERDRLQEKDYCDTILSRDWKGPKLIKEPLCAASRGRNPENPSDRTVGSPTEQRLEINYSGCCNTLTSVQKDNYVIEPLLIKENTNKGYVEAYEFDSVSLDQPSSKTRRGRVGNQISNTLTCSCNMGVVIKYRIRKLTPRECWRLMGVKDNQFDRLHGISKTNLYKLAGNSIVVDVLEAIFKNLIMPETTDTKGQLSLF